MNCILKILYNCIPAIVTSVIALIGVYWTVKSTRKDTDRTIKASEDASKKILYESVKPIIYALNYEFADTFNNIEYIFKAKIDNNTPFVHSKTSLPSHLIFTVKNTNNGIAIIKNISIKNTLYETNQLCVIEKGHSVDIGIEITTQYTPSDITLHVSDIYNNTYDYLCLLSGKNNVAISCDLVHKSEETMRTHTNQNTSIGDITNNSGFIGNTTAPITINNRS